MVAAVFRDGPRLLADVGGTNARFALETAPGRIEAIVVLPCKSYPVFTDAVSAYLRLPQVLALCGSGSGSASTSASASASTSAVRHAAIAIANPVTGDQIRMTNHDWQFSIEASRITLGLDTLLVVNDFEALAMALPGLLPQEKQQIGGGSVRENSVIGLLGAGTGLGVSGLIPAAGSAGWVALSAEGGHVTFSPADEREVAILRFAWQEFPHVSAERLLSGSGLELIYRALAARAGALANTAEPAAPAAPAAPTTLSAPEIVRRGLAGECAICDETIDCFCAMLGTAAGNLAVTLGTLGGVYIGGGIVPRLGERFAQSAFRQRFESKGRFGDYLARIPTFVITAEYPAFSGVSAILAGKLRG